MSHALQHHFAAALIDDDRPVPDGLAAWNGPRPERRFGVYRNNVIVGLTGALASRFPAAEKIVGAEFFAAMARAYVLANPPHSPLLLAYGDDFGDFVAGFEPARSLPYLPDVIRLEAARGRAYHAADAEPLDPARMASVAPETVGALRFVAHPAAAVVRSAHPVVTIWAMNGGDRPLAPITDWQGEDALVVRPQMFVNVVQLPSGGATFLLALMHGESLEAAVAMATAEAGDFDLSANLAGALQAGVFTDIQTIPNRSMTMDRQTTMAAMETQSLPQKIQAALRLLNLIPHDVVALISRLSIGAVFWQSGQTKLDGWQVSENAIYLFQNEYKLPFVDPWIGAHMAAFAEHFFPLLLWIGLASRLSALALLGMTLVIEIFVYPDAWPTHGTWAVCFLVIIAGGPGRLSLDHLISRHFSRQR